MREKDLPAAIRPLSTNTGASYSWTSSEPVATSIADKNPTQANEAGVGHPPNVLGGWEPTGLSNSLVHSCKPPVKVTFGKPASVGMTPEAQFPSASVTVATAFPGCTRSW